MIEVALFPHNEWGHINTDRQTDRQTDNNLLIEWSYWSINIYNRLLEKKWNHIYPLE